MQKTWKVGSDPLDLETVALVANQSVQVELARNAREKINRSRKFIDEITLANKPIYGVTTGFGALAEIKIAPEDLETLQRNLILSHAAGVGQPLSIPVVRAMMLLRAQALSAGHSGVRPVVVDMLLSMLNLGIHPIVPEKGSVGASGDLAPMSQIALLLMGEGKAYYQGELFDGKAAFEKAGIQIPGLQARDGLATINGSNVLTAMSALWLYDADRWLKQAEIAASMSLEALKANMKPYSKKIHEVRGFAGAIRSAESINKCVVGGDLKENKIKCKVQDAYSMRSTPQVIGAAHDALAYARSQVEIELNGVGDNPIFFPDEDMQLSGANFQGTPVAVPMDMAGYAITMVSVMSERRMNRLNNPALNVGLPAFLTKGAGMFSGLMLSQYTADTLIAEQRILSAPASIQSIPAAADQEDFVSMGMNTAIKNWQILDNAYGVLGIEFMAAAQALDFRDYQFGHGVTKAHEVIRKYVDFLDIDRPLHTDHTRMKELVKSCEILEEVEKVTGPLHAVS